MVGYTCLALEVVHAALDHGDELLQLLAHGFTEHVLLLLHLEALHAHLGLVCHPADQVKRAHSTLPLAGLLSQVLCQHRQQAEDLCLGAQVVEQRVEGILCAFPHGPSLVGQCVQGERHHVALLDEEHDLGQALCRRQLLEQSAQRVHGALTSAGHLLVGGGLLDLVEDAIALETAEADRILQECGEGIGSLYRRVRQLRGEYTREEGGDVFVRGRRRVTGFAHSDRGGHGRRLGMGHARPLRKLKGFVVGLFCELCREILVGQASKSRFWRGLIRLGGQSAICYRPEGTRSGSWCAQSARGNKIKG